MDLTARENIYLNGTVLGLTPKYIDEKFDEIVDFSELREFLDKWELPNCWVHMDTFHMNIDEADMPHDHQAGRTHCGRDIVRG